LTIHNEITSANERYAGGFAKGDLPMPPARRFAVVTCMDARLDPAKFLGLEEGDAHVIRNAGGLVTDDALRSLVISHHLLGTQEVFVIAHTDCGMLGGFNWSSQHLVMEVVRDGCWQASAGDSSDARSDVFAGSAVGGPTRGSAAVLASDRGWLLERGGGRGGGGVAGGWQPVVPRRWRDVAYLVGPVVGALFVVC